MPRTRDAIEARFRGGSNWFFVIAALSSLATTASYKGWVFKPLLVLSLATPMVLGHAASLVPPRFAGELIQQYSYLFGLTAAGLFGILGLLSKYGSHTGAFLKLGRIFGAFARLGQLLGMAHLVGSRLFYFAGIVLYGLDGAMGYALEWLLRSSPLRYSRLETIMTWNAAFHGVLLVLLLYGFLAGLEREARPPAEPKDG